MKLYQLEKMENLLDKLIRFSEGRFVDWFKRKITEDCCNLKEITINTIITKIQNDKDTNSSYLIYSPAHDVIG